LFFYFGSLLPCATNGYRNVVLQKYQWTFSRVQANRHGPALVLLHGFGIDSRVWKPQIKSLSSRFTIIAWDAPGAGHSSDPPPSFGLNDWATCLATLLDSVGIKKAHILGLSWGGILAQEFYRQ
jgi:pimeloyl-ACP methyl ester carboxylesterase